MHLTYFLLPLLLFLGLTVNAIKENNPNEITTSIQYAPEYDDDDSFPRRETTKKYIHLWSMPDKDLDRYTAPALLERFMLDFRNLRAPATKWPVWTYYLELKNEHSGFTARAYAPCKAFWERHEWDVSMAKKEALKVWNDTSSWQTWQERNADVEAAWHRMDAKEELLQWAIKWESHGKGLEYAKPEHPTAQQLEDHEKLVQTHREDLAWAKLNYTNTIKQWDEKIRKITYEREQSMLFEALESEEDFQEGVPIWTGLMDQPVFTLSIPGGETWEFWNCTRAWAYWTDFHASDDPWVHQAMGVPRRR
ncbi:hypothetical protein BP6252_01962 [Coleophoma cylindrospora]|uniref:Uncharacterized protein n=1 Tax=Coleophoma cylindrospora TaxID=1849047 RepID=A0A3D8SDH5_9HELO|nr:hypothetical protein BP6252_01962 [Coleophoma cylindrospora]